tara:strand:+ start:275 stop:406 length:132 start_codon:yes stop_codon:yes gene_type:complete
VFKVAKIENSHSNEISSLDSLILKNSEMGKKYSFDLKEFSAGE